MSPDPFGGPHVGSQLDGQLHQLQAAQEQLRRQQEQLAAATAAAEAETTTYEAAGGELRITVSGRGRIEDLYVSERVLRSGDAGPLLVQAVNEAFAAAATAQAERLSAGLDLGTADAVAAAGEAAAAMRVDGDR